MGKESLKLIENRKILWRNVEGKRESHCRGIPCTECNTVQRTVTASVTKRFVDGALHAAGHCPKGKPYGGAVINSRGQLIINPTRVFRATPSCRVTGQGSFVAIHNATGKTDDEKVERERHWEGEWTTPADEYEAIDYSFASHQSAPFFEDGSYGLGSYYVIGTDVHGGCDLASGTGDINPLTFINRRRWSVSLNNCVRKYGQKVGSIGVQTNPVNVLDLVDILKKRGQPGTNIENFSKWYTKKTHRPLRRPNPIRSPRIQGPTHYPVNLPRKIQPISKNPEDKQPARYEVSSVLTRRGDSTRIFTESADLSADCAARIFAGSSCPTEGAAGYTTERERKKERSLVWINASERSQRRERGFVQEVPLSNHGLFFFFFSSSPFLRSARPIFFCRAVTNECRSADASAGLTRPDGCSWNPGTPRSSTGTTSVPANEQNRGLNRQHVRAVRYSPGPVRAPVGYKRSPPLLCVSAG
ncbi:hypothetical protein WN55_09254 [Dufourea novaeangliae]|uniref:Uncharacterized protein n=1 Tax=Dufourea novaeangliae TaxID=178035 RepID=A0A154PAY5_DUFNO|nr:hypothetical protein WN55_09254 [Dufourea novaeangliae]